MGSDECQQSSKENSWSDYISDLLSLGSDLPWVKKIGQIWSVINKWLHNRSNVGMYEVLDYESILELKDCKGKNAIQKKHEKVQYLQDNIIAFQDQAWGDGKILEDYRCTPGIPVDSYHLGHKTYILISLQEVKNKGDIDHFNIEWNIKEGFLSKTGFWTTVISHRTKRISNKVIFPKSRPPRYVSIVEQNSQRTHLLGEAATLKLPDGRWLVSWERNQPRLYEQYILKWEW
ncbi:hypothetical protein KJ742_07205 [Patescibacteria group bacterium]|nr:hypothetical protein [Patescibacteria group bacterium]